MLRCQTQQNGIMRKMNITPYEFRNIQSFRWMVENKSFLIPVKIFRVKSNGPRYGKNNLLNNFMGMTSTHYVLWCVIRPIHALDIKRNIRRSEERRVGKECRSRWCT